MAISHTPLPPVAPGATVGILGSGQLGRMLALAAANLGLKTHIFAPDRGPACDVSTFVTIAPYEDEQALAAFADAVAVVTYEFENVPAATAAFLSARLPVLPDALALATTQDRLVEKDFLNGIGIATAPYKAVDDAGSLARAVAQIGRPSILKTRRFGYDGKGQAVVREGADLASVFRGLGGQACILEGTVPFVREVSVIAARGRDGSFAAWDVCENEHEHHILSRTLVPAQIAATTAHQATEITRRIVDALGYVGVIAVEMFVVEDKRSGTESLIVNEIAPRVHNSGHWTIDGAVTSQFAQHIRAICGWPLGSPRRHGRIEMRNLIGEDIHLWRDILGDGAAGLHIYGKHEARNGRKMGHVTRVLPEESAE
ncbi:MAG: 5-(carboxyamino)imidazole ribonucleotide synthase [Rhizobiales bacterium 62-17]|nr:5-(carboxyamino)imidazole ribonucleotide synthase [Hyphomicrobiales bacterium]OJY03330.1 MAG: 5-(carboxyamino)imidazole ribonucleotide synthase [Rhizobiales bacterium 62-17]